MSTPIIDEKSAEQIRALYDARLKEDLDVTLYTGQENEEAAEFTRRFLRELAELSDHIEYAMVGRGLRGGRVGLGHRGRRRRQRPLVLQLRRHRR